MWRIVSFDGFGSGTKAVKINVEEMAIVAVCVCTVVSYWGDA